MNKINSKVSRATLAAVTAVCAVLTFGATAFAAPSTLPVDPTGGAMGELSDNSTNWVKTFGIPAIIAMVALSVIVSLLIAWGRRGGRELAKK